MPGSEFASVIGTRREVLEEMMRGLTAVEHAEVLKLIEELDVRRADMGRMRVIVAAAKEDAQAATEAMEISRKTAAEEFAARLAAEAELAEYRRFCSLAARQICRCSVELGDAILSLDTKAVAAAVDSIRPVQLRVLVNGGSGAGQADMQTLSFLRARFPHLARGVTDSLETSALAPSAPFAVSHAALNLAGLLDDGDDGGPEETSPSGPSDGATEMAGSFTMQPPVAVVRRKKMLGGLFLRRSAARAEHEAPDSLPQLKTVARLKAPSGFATLASLRSPKPQPRQYAATDADDYPAEAAQPAAVSTHRPEGRRVGVSFSSKSAKLGGVALTSGTPDSELGSLSESTAWLRTRG